ncbi:hypothetical protein D917_06311 [Trichinella nativa]|uniref:Uncharacterized protein n=1 Tax=Trichinella nativa TaxID=6335 RepID=A0A1Y3ESV9_9BILA|nr:hypothetical protein D917_06311 [Trichinella nativa]
MICKFAFHIRQNCHLLKFDSIPPFDHFDSTTELTIFLTATHTYPDHSSQTFTPEKKIENENQTENFENDKLEIFKEIRRSSSASCESILKIIEANVESIRAKTETDDEESWRQYARDYVYKNLDDIIRCVRVLTSKQRLLLL